MANIIDHIGTIIISLTALIAAFFVLKSEIRKYLSQSRRDVILTISKSELQNLLNESFELTTRMAELTEQKISINWEMKHSSEKLIDRQKSRIRSLSAISETKLKNNFTSKFLGHNSRMKDPLLELLEQKETEITYTSDIYIQMNANSVAFLSQGFANALSVSVLTLKTRLYDVCRENHFLSKSDMEWEKFIKQTKNAFSLDTIEQLKTLFSANMSISDFVNFEVDMKEELENMILDSLKQAKTETEKLEEEMKLLEKEKIRIEEEISNIQKEKNNSIIDRYIKAQK